MKEFNENIYVSDLEVLEYYLINASNLAKRIGSKYQVEEIKSVGRKVYTEFNRVRKIIYSFKGDNEDYE